MKRRNLTLGLLAALGFLSAGAVESADTLVNARKVDRVVVFQGTDTLAVDVIGMEGNKDYNYSFRMGRNEDDYSSMSERRLNIEFPFVHKEKPRNTSCGMRSYGSMELTAFLGFGLSTAVNAPEGMSIDLGSSYEIFFRVLEAGRYFSHGKHSLTASLEFDWRNYRMDGYSRFVKDGNNVVLTDYPEGAAIDFSRIKTFSIAVPLEYNFRSTRHFYLSGGAIVNFNTYASIKNRYKDAAGVKQKELFKHIHQQAVTVDFRLMASWHGFGVYAKYSPCNVLDDAFAPKFQSCSFGAFVEF